MPLYYNEPAEDRLRQGEIIENLYEIWPATYGLEALGQQAPLSRSDHARVVVVTQDCDLEQDYHVRSQGFTTSNKRLEHIFFCDLHTENDVRGHSNLKLDIFKRVRQNQDERYHHFDEAAIRGTTPTFFLADLFVDFKRTFSLPSERVYEVISLGAVVRRCVIPQPYLQDFVHRLYSYLGRVAVS